jgi:four helix bundle suffix protein
MSNNDQFLAPKGDYKNLIAFQKTECIYDITLYFVEHYLPKIGDRTVDQMVQAARSGKQNIVEGSEDGKTSTEMELRLLNAARSSIGELRQDYEDFLKARHLKIWTPADERFQPMQDFTKAHNTLSDYEPYFQEWTAEEMANVGLTLCYQVDVMMNKYLKGVEEIFIKEGGVKERMHKARTNYRRQQDERLAELEHLKLELERQLAATRAEVDKWRAAYEDLKQRAVKAYNAQQKEIQRLRQELQGEEH